MSRSHFSPHRLVLLIAACAVAALVAAAVGSAAGSARRSPPSLTLVRGTPVTFVGRHFKPHARVHLKLTESGTVALAQTQTVKANSKGRFTAIFSAAIGRCSTWVVTAHESGVAPVVVYGPKPGCAPMSTS